MPPHGYQDEQEDFYCPVSSGDKTVGKSAISSGGANEPTYVMKGMPSKVVLQDFEIMTVIGKGKRSKVYLAQLKNDKEKVYAMKSISKKYLLDYA